MTQISREDVQRLAQLSRLQLDAAEIDALATDITNILGYVEQLNELDTEGVQPTYQVTGLENVWSRDDVQPSSVPQKVLLALAPDATDNQIKVPKVL